MLIINIILNIAIFLDEFISEMISFLACVLFLTQFPDIYCNHKPLY
jgi:hypothetical protein